MKAIVITAAAAAAIVVALWLSLYLSNRAVLVSEDDLAPGGQALPSNVEMFCSYFTGTRLIVTTLTGDGLSRYEPAAARWDKRVPSVQEFMDKYGPRQPAKHLGCPRWTSL